MADVPGRTLEVPVARPTRRNRWCVAGLAAAMVVLAVAVVVLFGWMVGSGSLASFGPGSSVMTPLTALAFALLALGTGAAVMCPVRRGGAVAVVVASVGLAVGLAVLSGAARFGWVPLGIADLGVITDDRLRGGRGLPSGQTTSAVLLLGGSLSIGTIRPTRRSVLAAAMAALAAGVIALTGLAGQAFETTRWYDGSERTSGFSTLSASMALTLSVVLVAQHVGPSIQWLRAKTPAHALWTALAVGGVLGPPALAAFAASERIHGRHWPTVLGVVAVVVSLTFVMLAWRTAIWQTERAVLFADTARLERERVERSEEANRATQRMLARISHELRTPLHAITGFGELLTLDVVDPEQAEIVGRIRAASDHLAVIVDDVTDLSRASNDELALALEVIPAADLARSALDIVRSGLRWPDIEFELATPVVGDSVSADPQRARQVLINLLTNAAKYNRPGGRVGIVVRRRGAMVSVDVVDTGPGISDDDLAKVFEPFERLGAESGPIEGTGLGLSIASALAARMGGSLEAVSEVGVGSTFSLVLPVVSPQPEGMSNGVGDLASP